MKATKRVRKNRFKSAAGTRGSKAQAKGARIPAILKGTAAGIGLGLLIAGVSVLFVFVHDLAVQCDYFRADTVEVSGQNRLHRQDVMDAAGLKDGENILAVNLTLARSRLMAHPWVEDASIRRVAPDRLLVEVREHEPLAVVRIGRAGEVRAGPSRGWIRSATGTLRPFP